MKVIDTKYKGYLFRSRLEARWAVFFDACGVKWEYEPEGFDLGDGLYYLPDFLLHDVLIRNYIKHDLWIEVKGQMTETDAKKIIKFADERKYIDYYDLYICENPILVVKNIPEENILEYIWEVAYSSIYPHYFNFETIDGDYYAAIPCITPQRNFAIVGSHYLEDCDMEETLKAYSLARQARFEHGY